MSDDELEYDIELDSISESLQAIHHSMERLSHDTKHLYANALKIHQKVEHPDTDIWAESFKLHERAHVWAKHHMVPRKCSFWQVHKTLLESAKRDTRIFCGHQVRLLDDEAVILDLPANHPISVWDVLARLPRFFV